MPTVGPHMVDNKVDDAKAPASPTSLHVKDDDKTARFATPDRDIPATRSSAGGSSQGDESVIPAANTVTPLEPSQATGEPQKVPETPSNKQVSFHGNVKGNAGKGKQSDGGEASTDVASQGVVASRQGGRYSSPSRSETSKEESSAVDHDTVPSLTSQSPGLQGTTILSAISPANEAARVTRQSTRKKKDTFKKAQASEASSGKSGLKPQPESITVDPSMIDSTSPLAEHGVDGSPQKKRTAKATGTPNRPERGPALERRNVTFSPQPPMREQAMPRKTPTRSPTSSGQQFQSLPSLSDAKLQSPCGIFLSPYSPNASAGQPITEDRSFDRGASGGQAEQAVSLPKKAVDEKAARTRDQERERAVSTPTDFTMDFGRGHEYAASFDASNVLAWLQSPTAHGLFSPGGGLGSTANTPRGGRFGAPRTPRTPTVGTSFFFSDVAGLPREGEFTSPKPQGVDSSSKRGNMICISPLAAKRGGHGGRGGQDETPTRYRDVFASPRLPTPRSSGIKPRSMPMLNEASPRKGPKNKGRSNLDAVHLAERELMEDEDLSVLLHLASHTNTPGQPGAGSGAQVFRSPRSRMQAQQRASRPAAVTAGVAVPGVGGPVPGIPGLQFPIIGQGGEGAKALARKTAFREPADANDFAPPPLGIRSSSSGSSRELIPASSGKKAGTTKGGASKSKPDSSKAKGKGGKAKGSKRGSPTTTAPPYPIPGSQMSYPLPGADPSVQYYPIPGSMPALPPGGNMRVVVGAPPQRAPSGSPPSGPPHSPRRPGPYTMQMSKDGGYGAPVGAPGPPPSAYHAYGHPPPMSGMSMQPPYYAPPPPPPHHMPLYTTLPRKPTKKTAKPKAGGKRAADASARGSPTKKQRKSPTKKKRRTQSPGTGAPVDRHKAAQAIQAVNQASGGKNDKAAALAAAILRGVTMRPSGKWQAQLYYAGKSRYIGVFDTREKAALAYEIAREKLKSEKPSGEHGAQSLKATEAAVNSARKAAFEGVNEKDPRLSSK